MQIRDVNSFFDGLAASHYIEHDPIIKKEASRTSKDFVTAIDRMILESPKDAMFMNNYPSLIKNLSKL